MFIPSAFLSQSKIADKVSCKPLDATMRRSISAGSKRGRTQQWSCRACTFLNDGEGEICGVCGSAHAKDVSLVPSISAAPGESQHFTNAWL